MLDRCHERPQLFRSWNDGRLGTWDFLPGSGTHDSRIVAQRLRSWRDRNASYSALSVSAGSIPAIRHVGMNAATTATTVKINDTATNVIQSCALTP